MHEALGVSTERMKELSEVFSPDMKNIYETVSRGLPLDSEVVVRSIVDLCETKEETALMILKLVSFFRTYFKAELAFHP